ncbi:hypothetical protein IGI04_007325 [Brassica rapa subsp. trilocularis]|nr:hypothetical protein IGI04_042963 [Brassica rapa subsp. trilocularis]KAG5374383.1 hypothetical protein IGI04_042300 [Brassica rapa subsp. trilocularis]KAG5375370.1 hypothetical protein IGI04_039966 [Brassica rapa subsp. trilocularis]KAG5411006.1 hypothetical protein IGI04_007325 [Brassica rapa subsp. trilocularis]
MLESLEENLSSVIITYLDDPTDLIRLAAVSHSCKRLVTRSDVLKKMFLGKADVADTACLCFENDKENAAYALLMRIIDYAQQFDLTIEALMASSTLSPAFNIENTLLTLESRQWSSIGREALSGMETLTFKLPNLCLVYGLSISSFQDTSLPGSPTFRSQRARFSFGNYNGNGVSETYSTQTHQMPSSGKLEVELPKPLLCINKQIVLELSDFVDKHPSEARYYIRVSSVKVCGISIADTFKSTISPSGQLVLEAISYLDPKIKKDLIELERNHLTVDGANDADIHDLARFLNPDAH